MTVAVAVAVAVYSFAWFALLSLVVPFVHSEQSFSFLPQVVVFSWKTSRMMRPLLFVLLAFVFLFRVGSSCHRKFGVSIWPTRCAFCSLLRNSTTTIHHPKRNNQPRAIISPKQQTNKQTNIL